ncbi:MAG TPA: DUF1501 domain-containing protein [Isosphaeraceae bacterium]|nr:DUF1501 domain-containing protein [Isosphaeraceae bacterium]
MLTVGRGQSQSCAGVTRRDFLRVGGLGLGGWGLSLSGLNARETGRGNRERSAILLLLVGGPSQLETFDPKPGAPAEIRGPFDSIATRCPGVRISEHLPRLAARLDRVAIVRSVHHDAAPIHETGYQLLQTGRLCRAGEEWPHLGSWVAKLQGIPRDLPPFLVLPGPISSTGVNIPHGQSAGWLGSAFDPFHLAADPAAADFDPQGVLDRARAFLDAAVEPHESSRESVLTRFPTSEADRIFSRAGRNAFDLGQEREAVRDAYGRTTFGQSCLLARRLVEAGVRLVTVNMFETVFNQVTWDCHGVSPFSTLDDYARDLLPTFDRAFAALLEDLERSGRLESTLVLAAGEFGRTPRINAAGGRDHWPGVWSVLLAGGGIQGGQVVGSSDAHAAAPADRPVTLPDLVASIDHSLGIDASQYVTRPDGQSHALVEDGKPIQELFV